jgi:hypothetical protein
MLKNFLDIDITDKSLNASNINNNILYILISIHLLLQTFFSFVNCKAVS